MFEGEWKEGERVQGKLVKNNFDWIYEGPFLKNVPHGKGSVTIKGKVEQCDVFGGMNYSR